MLLFLIASLPSVRADDDLQRAQSLVSNYCVGCHEGNNPDGEIDLTRLEGKQDVVNDRARWEQIRQRVVDLQMPPRDAEQLSTSDRDFLCQWISGVLQDATRKSGPRPGPFRLRRLNRDQYSNTMRDLLAINFDVGAELPEDGAGGEGFDNAAETLFLSPLHAEKYIDAAVAAFGYVAKNNTSRELLITKRPGPQVPEADAARQTLTDFATRAYRRPVAEYETAGLLKLFHSARQNDIAYDESLFEAMTAVVCSPSFLILMERPSRPEEVEPVSIYEFATRISYFLFNSMPDESLRHAAMDGALDDPEKLKSEIDRMIHDRRFQGFLESFVGQWLGTKDIGIKKRPDPVVFPQMNDEVADSLRIEPVRTLEYIIRHERPLLDLIDADYIFMNEDIAPIYQVETPGRYLSEYVQRYDLPKDSIRGGIVTMAGPLLVSSHSARTSPVLRGKWLMETVLGYVPPPPPPGIPALEESTNSIANKTVRQRLEEHRANASCASCHDAIDPLGFGLECFDPIGKFRDSDNGSPLDLTGQLPSGKSFDGPAELKKILLENKDSFTKQLVRRIFGFAVGRSLVESDFYEIERITAATIAADYRLNVTLYEIINSVPFRTRGISNRSPLPTEHFTSLHDNSINK